MAANKPNRSLRIADLEFLKLYQKIKLNFYIAKAENIEWGYERKVPCKRNKRTSEYVEQSMIIMQTG